MTNGLRCAQAALHAWLMKETLFLFRRFLTVGSAAAFAFAAVFTFASVVARLAAALALAGILPLAGVLFFDVLGLAAGLRAVVVLCVVVLLARLSVHADGCAQEQS